MRIYGECFGKFYKQHSILFTGFSLCHQRDLMSIISCKGSAKAGNLSQLIAAKPSESHETQKATSVLRKIRNSEECGACCAISVELRTARKNKYVEEVTV